MRSLAKQGRFLIVLCLVLSMALGMTVSATSSDDNSLSDLGILTEGAVVSPEFAYGTVTYDVLVPAGTTELSLDPVTTNSEAQITEITGTQLDEDGSGTVYITVTAQNGDPFTYTLNVTREAAAETETEAQTQAQTEVQTEPQTEAATEDSRYVKVDKNTIQEAENTITELKSEITGYRETVSLYTKIMYGLIGLSVVLLFIVINLALKRKDLKEELREYRSLGYAPSSGKGGKAKAPVERTAAPQRPQNQAQPRTDRDGGQDAQGVRKEQAPRRSPAPAAEDVRRAPEVKPQVSRKAKTMPAYEEEKVQSSADNASHSKEDTQTARAERKAQAKAKQAAAQEKAKAVQSAKAARAQEQPQQAPVQPEAKAESPKDKDVQIDLIDL